MTPLRQRYAEDLRARNKSPRTIETYVLRVRQFAEHFGKSPEQLGPDELRAYQQHLLQRQVSWSMFNQSVCALRFLYNVTLFVARRPSSERAVSTVRADERRSYQRRSRQASSRRGRAETTAPWPEIPCQRPDNSAKLVALPRR